MGANNNFINRVGEKFGQLTVVSRDMTKTSGGRVYWICKCSCGTIKSIRADAFVSGNVVSCGCNRNAKNGIGKHRTHNLGHIPEYSVWTTMKARCKNPNNKDFEYYGARGISVCDKWANSFSAFINDMGRRPSDKHSIDRINNDGNYEPSNCRWATHSQQMKNRRPTSRKRKS